MYIHINKTFIKDISLIFSRTIAVEVVDLRLRETLFPSDEVMYVICITLLLEK